MDNKQRENLLYLYDLPKDVHQVAIAKIIFNKTGILITKPPQIKRDFMRPMYNAYVNFDGHEDHKELGLAQCFEKMRYFDIDGKPCRGLKFNKNMLGANKDTLNKGNNLFVRNIPKNVHSDEDVHKQFEKFGEILSLKASKNQDHTLRGYGFVCFANEEAAKRALDAQKDHAQFTAVKFQPKDPSQINRNLVNNIYVKNIPDGWSEDDLKKIFGEFGHITSLVMKQSEIGRFLFVCYGHPSDAANHTAGPESAQKAIEKLHGKDHTFKGVTGNLYVKAALPKSQRDQEKKKEFLKFKTSKKRCNLYVRNFPDSWTEETLGEIFSKYGEIESKKLIKNPTGSSYAFVCYKQPDYANEARNQLAQQPFDGKTLQITNYEIKEIRELQMLGAKEKTDFDRYIFEQTNNKNPFKDLNNDPKMTQLLQYVVNMITQQQNTQQVNMGGFGPRGNFNKPNNRRPPQQHQQMPMNNMPPQQMAPPMMAPTPQPHQMSVNQQYTAQTAALMPLIVPNKDYKQRVGETIYKFIQGLAPADRVPKITGMLIELPVDQVKQYMSNYETLKGMVAEANELIDRNGAQ